MKANKKITTAKEYKATMAKLDMLMTKGSKAVSQAEMKEIQKNAMAAQQYEQATFSISMPTTISGIIEMKMFEMKLKQKDLSKKLKVSDTKLSMIMNGKQKPDVNFLKAVHQQLNVSGDFLLDAV